MKGASKLNSIVLKAANRLVNLKLIERDKKDFYSYHIEMLFLRVIGIILIVGIGVITKKYIQTIVFYVTFSSLRSYTNGYHSKHYIVCLIQSGATYILICKVISLLFLENLLLFHFISIVSIIVIYVLAPVNSNSVMLSKEEVKQHKKTLKYMLYVFFIALVIFINFKIKNEIVVFLRLQ